MTCATCGKELAIGEWPFCGGINNHGFASSFTVQGDEIDWTIENMGPQPLRFRSKSAWKRELERRGLVNRVEHTPTPGSDRSPHTSRWV